MRIAIAVVLALVSTGAIGECLPSDPPCVVPRSWHLLTITEGGTVTLLKQLTKHECEFAMHRAKGEPATDEEIADAKRRAEEDRKAREEEYAKLVREKPYCAKTWSDFKYSIDTPDARKWYLDCNPLSLSVSTGHYVSPGDIKSAECFE